MIDEDFVPADVEEDELDLDWDAVPRLLEPHEYDSECEDEGTFGMEEENSSSHPEYKPEPRYLVPFADPVYGTLPTEVLKGVKVPPCNFGPLKKTEKKG